MAYASPPPDVRSRHPYHMYEEIKAQPAGVARSLAIVHQGGAEVSRLCGAARRVFVTGCGTSFHAAQIGAWTLQALTRGAVDARSIQAFDLVRYLPGLRPDDLVLAVSHSGATTMTVRALEHARSQGCETVLVTGFPQSPGGERAGHVLPTGYGEERSWAHTASYTAAVATLTALANELASVDERLDLSPLPAVVEAALELEEMAHRLAAGAILSERTGGPVRIVLVGGGPNAATAVEGALKLQETSFVRAVAFQLEEMLHGPLAAVTPDTLLIVIAPAGRSSDRAAELVGAARQIGTVPVVLAGGDTIDAFEGAHRLLLPDVPEALSPIPYAVPLQLFSYFLAVGKGANPDLLHRDDERYRAARAQYA